MTLKIDENPTKYFKGRTLADQRVYKRMTCFCEDLKINDHKHSVIHEFWLEVQYPKSRDTKHYYKSLSRELLMFMSKTIPYSNSRDLNEAMKYYLSWIETMTKEVTK